jgi:hypothetical protein
LACINHTRECYIQTQTYQNCFCVSRNHSLRVKSHSACRNRNFRVEINLVRVEITLVRVGITCVCVEITFVLVEITLRVEITLEVYESH